MSKRRMELGPASGWAPWQPKKHAREHAPYDYEHRDRYWGKPYERFLDRRGLHRRYPSGPSAWRPGRYRTSAWQPYSGFGRFSGLSEIMDGKYHAARYTGRHVTPEHYTLNRWGVEVYEQQLAERWRKTSWTPNLEVARAA
jgi:hypothetical protein